MTQLPKSGWAGVALSAAAALVLTADGLTGLLAPQVLAAPMAETGFPSAMLWVIGTAALGSALVYAIPRTAFLGAVLITAFCGGAIATHVRIGELGSAPQIVCLLIAVAAWAGLYLRDPRLRALLTVAPGGGGASMR